MVGSNFDLNLEGNINQKSTLKLGKFVLKLLSLLQGKLQFLFKYHLKEKNVIEKQRVRRQ